MKIRRFILLCLLFTAVIYSQNIDFTDANFKAKLLQASSSNTIASLTLDSYGTPNAYTKIDTNDDGDIDYNEALSIRYLNVGYSNIHNLNGIEYFSNLEHLRCNNNFLSNINISSLTTLYRLFCFNNNFTSLNLEEAPSLIGINCSNNQLTSLTFVGLSNLRSVNCMNNNISALDFGGNSLFSGLYCKNNQLTSINIKNGQQQEFFLINGGTLVDCWAIGNPNLTNICVDNFEVAGAQAMLNSCATGNSINVNSLCALGNEEFTASNEAITIYPNPSSGIFNISFDKIISQKISLEVYNPIGQIIVIKELIGVKEYQLSMDDFASGTYLIKVSDGHSSVFKKVIIK